MNNVQALLLRSIGAALFGGDMPAVDEQYIEPLLKESKSQAVYPRSAVKRLSNTVK